MKKFFPSVFDLQTSTLLQVPYVRGTTPASRWTPKDSNPAMKISARPTKRRTYPEQNIDAPKRIMLYAKAMHPCISVSPLRWLHQGKDDVDLHRPQISPVHQ